jgi:hypothetical protein
MSSTSSAPGRAPEGPTKILKQLFIGSQQDAKDRPGLLRLGITHIMNCTPPKSMDPVAGCPNFFEKEKLFTYKRIPVFDNAGENLLDYMDAAIEFIDCAKYYGAVLVHCKKGVSRSASFVVAYLMKVNEFSLTEALEYVQSQRPAVGPNQAFMSQLRQFEERLTAARQLAADKQDKDDSAGLWSCGPSGRGVSMGPASGPASGPAVAEVPAPSGPPPPTAAGEPSAQTEAGQFTAV